MPIIQLDKRETHVLRVLLREFSKLVPISDPQWHDLAERTKFSPENTLRIVNQVRRKLRDADVRTD